MTKDELRREMRRRLRTLGDTRAEKSRAIVETVAAHPDFLRSDRVALFAPLPSEPDIEGLWAKGARGFCYPRVTGETIEFVNVPKLAALTPAAWNPTVREPAFEDARIISPDEIELILVPGLAFTRDGQRLGRGGGFYDRFLSRLPGSTCKLGVCFDQQIVASLPAEAHDQLVDAVATESGLISR